MSNALFLSSRFFDRATVAASSVAGNLPASHLQTMSPDQVWRSVGCAAEWLSFDLGAAVVVDSVVAVAHNLSAAANWRLRLASMEANVTTAPDVDSGMISPWPSSGKPSDPDWPAYLSLLRVPNTTPYRYGRLDIADPSNPDGFIQIGRLFSGPAFVPSANIDLTIALGLISPDEAGRTAFGHAVGDPRGPACRVMTIPMSTLEEDEMAENLFELQRYCGVGRDFAFVGMPAATTKFHKFAMQARFETLQAFQAQPLFSAAGQVWSTALSLTEVH